MNSTVCTHNRKRNHGVAPARDDPEVRVEKVLSVKRQLYEGRYSVADKLNTTLDRILEELLQQPDVSKDKLQE